MLRNAVRRHISVQLALGYLVVYVVAAVLLVLLVRDSYQDAAMSKAREEARIIADYNLAVHQYFSHDLKPPLFDLTDGIVDPDYFEPSWMSSTYAVRGITGYFDELSDEAYYYRECAINARSPENEADEVERRFIAECQADPDLVESSGVREIDGVPNYVVMRRAESMDETCLRCHTDPDVAPGDLVEQYGASRSFNRELGELVSVISVRIPLAEAYAEADALARQLSLVLLALLVVGFGVLLVFTHARVSVPLAALEARAASFRPTAEWEGAPDTTHVEGVGESTRTQDADSAANEVERLANSMLAMSDRIERQMADLVEANERLTETSEAKSRFLANMSHELRTPLNSMIGFVGIVLQGLAGDLTEEQERQLTMAHDSAKHLLRLVNDLLDMSAAESGMIALEPTTFRIEDLVEEVVTPLRDRARAQGLTLRVHAPDECEVHADRLRAGQVIRNLVDNALKYTEDGGITVEVRCTGDRADVVVSDTGPGIPASEIEHIFDAYTQVSVRGEAKPRGTGLGLTLARSYARMLGGDVTVSSDPGVGSTFTFAIPRAADDARSAPGSPASSDA